MEYEPMAAVHYSTTVSDSRRATVQPNSLIFTPENYDIPQRLTVHGTVSDTIVEDAVYSVDILLLHTEDALFSNLYGGSQRSFDILGLRRLRDRMSARVTPVGGGEVCHTSEAGSSCTVTVQLVDSADREMKLSHSETFALGLYEVGMELRLSDVTEAAFVIANTSTTKHIRYSRGADRVEVRLFDMEPISLSIVGVDDFLQDGDMTSNLSVVEGYMMIESSGDMKRYGMQSNMGSSVDDISMMIVNKDDDGSKLLG